MSTVNREDAINAMWKALHEYEDNTEKKFIESDELDIGDWIQHREYVQNMSDIDRRIILRLPSADKWTPVTEGKPKDYQHVLVTVKGVLGRRFVKDVLYVEDLAKYDDLTFMEHRPGFVDYDSEWGSYEETDVLAWMPVVKPWEGEEK